MDSKRTLLECRLARERDRFAAAVVFGVLRPRGVRAKPAGAKPVRQPRHHPLHLLPCAKARSSISSSPRLSRNCWPSGRTARGTYCAPAAPPEKIRYSVSMLVEDYAQTHPIPSVRITGIDLSQPAIEEARTAAYYANLAHQQGAPSLAQCVLRSERSAVHRCRAHPLARSFWRRATSATTKSCAGRTTSSCAETFIIYLKAEVGNQVIATLHRHLAHRATSCWGTPRSSRERTLFKCRGTPFIEDKRKRPTYEHETEQHQHKPHLDDILRHRDRPVLPFRSQCLYGVHANASMTKEFYNRPYMVAKSAVALRFHRGDVDVRRAAA